MNKPPEPFAAASLAEPLLSLRDVRRTFVTAGGEVEVQALRGITLDIYPGEFVAIMGQSGSGKTTLMNILGCLDKPTSGSYLFAARTSPISIRQSGAAAARGIRLHLSELSISSALRPRRRMWKFPRSMPALPPHERRAHANDIADTRSGIGDRTSHRPNQLSGGQQQRVSIARALMNGGRIVLADEPTGALDTKSGAEVMALLGDLAAHGHTVILITHDKSVAAHAKRIIEIRDGEIVSDSGPGSIARGRRNAAAHYGSVAEIGLRAQRSDENGAARLHVNFFRTALTLLGIIIGVASVVVMLAVGDGSKQKVLDQITAMGTNILSVRTGAPGIRASGDIITLTAEDATAMLAIVMWN